MILMSLLLVILALGLSWGGTVGLIYLICLCFSWEFNLLIATGIWLVLTLISSFITRGD